MNFIYAGEGSLSFFLLQAKHKHRNKQAIRTDSSKMKDLIQLGKISARVFLAHFEILTVEAEILLQCPLVSGKRNSQRGLDL